MFANFVAGGCVTLQQVIHGALRADDMLLGARFCQCLITVAAGVQNGLMFLVNAVMFARDKYVPEPVQFTAFPQATNNL